MMLLMSTRNRRNFMAVSWEAPFEFVGVDRPHCTIGFFAREMRGATSKRLILRREGSGLRFARSKLRRRGFWITRMNDMLDVTIKHGLTNLARRMFGHGSSNGTHRKHAEKHAKDGQCRHDFDSCCALAQSRHRSTWSAVAAPRTHAMALSVTRRPTHFAKS